MIPVLLYERSPACGPDEVIYLDMDSDEGWVQSFVPYRPSLRGWLVFAAPYCPFIPQPDNFLDWVLEDLAAEVVRSLRTYLLSLQGLLFGLPASSRAAFDRAADRPEPLLRPPGGITDLFVPLC
jgi:hypothetical protein